MTQDLENAVVVPPTFSKFRRYALDGALLLFDRNTGLNALCEGVETLHLRRRAPRVLQFAITNRCNLACEFCSRVQTASSEWTSESAFDVLSDFARAGVLEVAFGGGEPWAFPGFTELLCRLHDETPLAVSVTTNGLALTASRIASVRGRVGQIRLSLYDDNDWPARVSLLAESGVRFGINYLVTPRRLPELEATLLRLVDLGCRDLLLLSYKGEDLSLHLSAAESASLARRTEVLQRALAGRARFKLDICWGERMEPVSRLFRPGDCGAGLDFLVITSDRRLMPCSFHHLAIPFADVDEALAIWRGRRSELLTSARSPGCARAPEYGLGGKR